MPGLSQIERKEIKTRNVCGVHSLAEADLNREIGNTRDMDVLFDLDGFRRALISSVKVGYERHERAMKLSAIKYSDLPPLLPIPGPLDEKEIHLG
jgi:hypothetical protein